MIGISVSLKDFKKVPVYLKDRLLTVYSGKDKIHLISPDNDRELIGETICFITSEPKLPVINDKDEIEWIYRKWADWIDLDGDLK